MVQDNSLVVHPPTYHRSNIAVHKYDDCIKAKGFATWFWGQTGLADDAGELFVYKHDWERFCEGKDDAEWDDVPDDAIPGM